MPVQTQKKSNIYFPDGALVAVRKTAADPWFDVGAIQSAVENALEYDENQVETANAGKLDKQIRNMTMAGSFTLINLDPEGVEKLGGGMFTRETTTAAPLTPVDQIMSSIQLNVAIPIVMLDSSGNNVRTGIEPAITSVTASTAGVLAKDDDFAIIPDQASPSKYSMVFRTGTAGLIAGEDVTIVFDLNNPIASQIIYVGSSTVILTAYGMRITHTDDNAKIRQLELFSVDPNSGGFAFNFKGANEDGVEEMPLTYTAKLDTSLTSGRQLAAWTIEEGAQ